MTGVFRRRRLAIQDAIRGEGIDGLLVFSPESLYYLTGYASGHAPACAMVPAAGKPILIAAAQDQAGAAAADGCDVKTYDDDTIERPCDALDEMCLVLNRLIGEMSMPHERLATEGHAVPAGVVAHLKMEDRSVLLRTSRMIKDAVEIEHIRDVVGLIDFAQEIARQKAEPGISEIELFGAIQSALQARAGRPIVVQGDLLSGDRTGLIGGLPGSRRMAANDPAIVDLQIRGGPYWADTTRTFALGRVSDPFKRLFDAVAEALDRALQAAGPGVPSNAVDRAARDVFVRHGYGRHFPHHTGHGCGLCYYEPPLIVPNNPQLLREGMVLCLEPGLYVPDVGGVRLEQMVVITAEGNEVMSRAPIVLGGGHA